MVSVIHACGHAKEGKFCKVCAAERSRHNYERLQGGPTVWRELAIKPWRHSANSMSTAFAIILLVASVAHWVVWKDQS